MYQSNCAYLDGVGGEFGHEVGGVRVVHHSQDGEGIADPPNQNLVTFYICHRVARVEIARDLRIAW